MSGLKILLIAPWGYPPLWRTSNYQLNNVWIAGRTFSGRCTGCSSSLCLYFTLKSSSKIADTWLLVIGSDSVISPEKRWPIRENVEKWFNDIKKQLFDTTKCEEISKKSEWLEDIYVEVVPSIGQYYGYYFKGDIIEVFVEAYRAITNYMEKLKPSIIVLDTTHGLNILTIATLYATIAASIIYNKKVYIFNSEPYPPGTRTKACVKGEKPVPIDNTPELNIHDISTLQWIIDYLRALNFLRYLNEKPLAKMIRVIEGIENPLINKLVTNMICMIEALRTGLLGLIYNNSKFSNGENISFTIRSIVEKLKELPKIQRDKPWTKPIVRDKNVEYELSIKDIPIRYIPILDALRKIIGELEGLAEIESLKEFTKQIAILLDSKGYWEKKQIIVHEAFDLLDIVEEIYENEKTTEIDRELLRKYWKKRKGIKDDREGASAESSHELVSPRNFAAHAALNHNVLEKIKTSDDGKDIVEIVYNYTDLKKTIKQIGDKTSLMKCIS